MENRVVCSVSGRDRGILSVVLGRDERGLLLADGKRRPLEKPKHKNPKHVVYTEYLIEDDTLLSNKSLRRKLAICRSHGLRVEELICQKKI